MNHRMHLYLFIAQPMAKEIVFYPKKLLVPAGIDNEALAEVLGVTVRTPQRGRKRAY